MTPAGWQRYSCVMQKQGFVETPAGAPSPGDALNVEWAFVVHLRKCSGMAAENMQGRVEHVNSGQATGFESLAELANFMHQTIVVPDKEQ